MTPKTAIYTIGSYFLQNPKNLQHSELPKDARIFSHAFGILASRWRIFRRPILATPEKSKEIVKAALSLHNFVKYEERNVPVLQRRYCPPRYVDTDDNGNIIEGMWRNEIGDASGIVGINQTGSNMFKKRARETREKFENYFVSDIGKVEWQNTSVHFGEQE
ncbi:unnamed protein product [Mytilus edulis]|uniref:DDE Tnp4 domain-containing protein n=1 Tax=Mytilus edulis TaxID=6550 RepID=A0A8S3SWE9_MYTED|nr:unnamed protein product [Mytilus edulis]